ncbi:MAG: phosphoglycerate kinase [Candidatus Micrarchaeota archaeon]
MPEFKTMDDFDPSGKVVLLRVDVNAPFDEATGKIGDSGRFAAHAQTIKELANKKARVIVLAHQSRVGKKDFTNLRQHADWLSKHSRKKVRYVPAVYGEYVEKAVEKLKPGKIILLENVRMLAEEDLQEPPAKLGKLLFVKELSKLADFYVNDAFSAAHRAQTSLVGFPEVLPSYAGRVMQSEFEAVSKAIDGMDRPSVYVLGGAKPDDCIDLMKYALSNGKVDYVLVSGVIGELCLIAAGKDFGAKKQWLEEQKYLERIGEIKELVQAHGEKVILPIDFAVKDKDGFRIEVPLSDLPATGGQSFDIGRETAKLFANYIKQARTIYFKGPVGKYEDPVFELGTKTILQAIQNTPAFTIMGGGHSLDAIEKFGVNKKKISHISIAGGAVIAMLSGQALPSIEALKNAANR